MFDHRPFTIRRALDDDRCGRCSGQGRGTARRKPGGVERCTVEPLVLEKTHGGVQMLFGFAHAAAPYESAEQQLMHLEVVRSQLAPGFQMLQGFVVRRTCRQLLQQLDAIVKKTVSLRGQPGGELRTAVDLHSLHEVAAVDRRQRATLLDRKVCKTATHGIHEFEGIDAAAGQVEPHRVVLADETLARPEDAAHPAQAPAQFSTRVVGRVPQQFT